MTDMKPTLPPLLSLPEADIENHEYELWGNAVKADLYSAARMKAYATAYGEQCARAAVAGATNKAIAFDWLLSNCLIKDRGGWIKLVFETSRQHEHHEPDCAKWVAMDIGSAAGVDLDDDAATPPAVEARVHDGWQETIADAIEALEWHASRYDEESLPDSTVSALEKLRALLSAAPAAVEALVPHKIVEAWAEEKRIRFVSRSHGLASTDTISRSALEDLVSAALSAAPAAPKAEPEPQAVHETNAVLASRYFDLLKVVESYEVHGVTCQNFRHFVAAPCAECNAEAPGPQAVAEPDMQKFKNMLSRYEHQWHRMGELWERCQGKAWPEKESEEFARLRDKSTPDTRLHLLAMFGTQPPTQQASAQGEQPDIEAVLKPIFLDAMDWGRSYGSRLNLPEQDRDDVSAQFAELARKALTAQGEQAQQASAQPTQAAKDVPHDNLTCPVREVTYMDIYAGPGTRVQFHARGGHEWQKVEAKKMLELGGVYTVWKTEVGSCSSTVRLKEVHGDFNTVMFGPAPDRASNTGQEKS